MKEFSRFPCMGEVKELECFNLISDRVDYRTLAARHCFYYLVDEDTKKGLSWIVGVNYLDAQHRQVTIINKNRRVEKRSVELSAKVVSIPKGYEKEDEEALEVARLGLKQ